MEDRLQDDELAAVVTSDLARAVEMVEIAFAGSEVPVLADWRLRECDDGDLNGASGDAVHDDREERLSVPYPGGESWSQAVDRAAGLLRDLPRRWSGQRVLVVGHVATRWALDHHLRGIALETLAARDAEGFAWQPGLEYALA